MIEVKNLGKTYGNKTAVDHLNFTVQDGQIYGFLGPNGAGKSTTMNMITGYLAPSSGTVVINGHDILKDTEEAKKCIGYLPEIPPVYMDMTVNEYLTFVAELKKIPKKERRKQIEMVMEKTSVTTMRQRLIKNLSKGYRQRVGMAQAMLGNPNVIILDEPMVGLDPVQIIEIRELIRELAKEHTIMISSHILSEISEICDHVLIIENGKIVANGSMEEITESTKEKGYCFHYEWKASEEQIREVFAEVDGIQIESVQTVADGITRAVFTMNEDKREEIFQICVREQIVILGLFCEEKSLEDVFLEITAKEERKTMEKDKEAVEKEDKKGELLQEEPLEMDEKDTIPISEENQESKEASKC